MMDGLSDWDSAKPSFAFYNNLAEADALVETLRKISLRR